MKDIEKIRAEIERLIKTEQGFDSGEAESAYRMCAKDIISFIDSLQKEPLSSIVPAESREKKEEPVRVWHNADEEPDNDRTILLIDGLGEAYVVCDDPAPLDANDKWAYIDDVLKL